MPLARGGADSSGLRTPNPPPPKGASGQQLVVNGTDLRSPWAQKAPNSLWEPGSPNLLSLHFSEGARKMI